MKSNILIALPISRQHDVGFSKTIIAKEKTFGLKKFGRKKIRRIKLSRAKFLFKPGSVISLSLSLIFLFLYKEIYTFTFILEY